MTLGSKPNCAKHNSRHRHSQYARIRNRFLAFKIQNSTFDGTSAFCLAKTTKNKACVMRVRGKYVEAGASTHSDRSHYVGLSVCVRARLCDCVHARVCNFCFRGRRNFCEVSLFFFLRCCGWHLKRNISEKNLCSVCVEKQSLHLRRSHEIALGHSHAHTHTRIRTHTDALCDVHFSRSENHVNFSVASQVASRPAVEFFKNLPNDLRTKAKKSRAECDRAREAGRRIDERTL